MRKIISLLILIASISTYSQFQIKGVMTEAPKGDWVILYKTEGAKQNFIENTKIIIDSVSTNNIKKAIGTFIFKLPKEAKSGFYRAVYNMNKGGFVDFIFNQKDVSFAFHPDYPGNSVTFESSEENNYYYNSAIKIQSIQNKIDSIQFVAVKYPVKNLESLYKKEISNLNQLKTKLLHSSENPFVNPYLETFFRKNSDNIITSLPDYQEYLEENFLANLDFSKPELINSPILANKIIDYVFFVNFSYNINIQQIRQKKAVDRVLNMIKNISFKKEIIEFLITQFEKAKNVVIADFLIEKYKTVLPENLINSELITKTLKNLIAEVGRTAPDFSWQENNEKIKLSSLKGAEKYILIFYSTTCSHCVRDIPKVHDYFKENKNVKVIGFALETETSGWEDFTKNLNGWHHVLGLGKWENNTARVYNIDGTPTYFVLDKNKKIIAKPDTLENLQHLFPKK